MFVHVCMYVEEHVYFFPPFQNVWCWRSAVWEEEVDPLLWGCDRHHFLRGPQRLWPGAGWGRGDGECLSHTWRTLSGDIVSVYRQHDGSEDLSVFSITSLFPHRTECTRVWNCSTASATTSGSQTPPSSSSSTRRTCLRRRSRRVLLPSATLNTLVRLASSCRKCSKSGLF